MSTLIAALLTKKKEDRRASPRIASSGERDPSLLPDYVKDFQVLPIDKFPARPSGGRRAASQRASPEPDPAHAGESDLDRRASVRMPMEPVGEAPKVARSGIAAWIEALASARAWGPDKDLE